MSEESKENIYVAERRKHRRDLETQGIAPYPAAYGIKPEHTAAEILQTYKEISPEALEKETKVFCVAGRMVAIRLFGNAAFVKLRDRTGRIQIFFEKQTLGQSPKGVEGEAPPPLAEEGATRAPTIDSFKLFKTLAVGYFGYVQGPLF